MTEPNILTQQTYEHVILLQVTYQKIRHMFIAHKNVCEIELIQYENKLDYTNFRFITKYIYPINTTNKTTKKPNNVQIDAVFNSISLETHTIVLQ